MKFLKDLKDISTTVKQLPTQLGAESVRFSKERFVQQNWMDNSTESWKKRNTLSGESKRRRSRHTLVDTGNLKKSIRVIGVSQNHVLIGTEVPYAQIHNEGGKIQGTQKVKAHVRTRKGRKHTVGSHSRKVNYQIPKRQFLGESAALERKLNRLAIAKLNKAFR